MSDLQSALGNAGARHVLRHGGRDYPVSFLIQAKKTEFSEWLKAEALAFLFSLRPHLSEKEWAQKFAEHKEECISGVYDFHGAVSAAALRGGAGNLKLVQILLGITQDEAAELVRHRAKDLQALLEVVLAESRSGVGPDAEGNVPAAA